MLRTDTERSAFHAKRRTLNAERRTVYDTWTFDAGNKFYEEAVQKVARGVENASQAIEKRPSSPYSNGRSK
jgi:hypothetical protein